MFFFLPFKVLLVLSEEGLNILKPIGADVASRIHLASSRHTMVAIAISSFSRRNHDASFWSISGAFASAPLCCPFPPSRLSCRHQSDMSIPQIEKILNESAPQTLLPYLRKQTAESLAASGGHEPLDLVNPAQHSLGYLFILYFLLLRLLLLVV